MGAGKSGSFYTHNDCVLHANPNIADRCACGDEGTCIYEGQGPLWRGVMVHHSLLREQRYQWPRWNKIQRLKRSDADIVAAPYLQCGCLTTSPLICLGRYIVHKAEIDGV